MKLSELVENPDNPSVDFIRSKLVFDPAKWKDINEWVKSLESQYYTLLEEVEALDFVKAGYALTENDIVEAIENA